MENKSGMSLGSLTGLAALVIILYLGANALGNNQRLATGVHYLTTGQTSLDYHTLARQDALNYGIDPNLYERQIHQESGFNPNAVSPAGAIGIAQIMPATAQAWGVDPWNPVQSLNVAADHMAWYVTHYGDDYAKGLAAYNAGTSTLDSALAHCGSAWKSCVPTETQHYITAIMGG